MSAPLPPPVIEIVVPELGLGELGITLSVWHVRRGQPVRAGEQLLELVAGSVVVDLPAPASGILQKILVHVDESVIVGQVLARLAAEPECE